MAFVIRECLGNHGFRDVIRFDDEAGLATAMAQAKVIAPLGRFIAVSHITEIIEEPVTPKAARTRKAK